MTRQEATVLVSRALSVLFGISALYETSYLPERLFSFVHYRNAGGYYLPELYRFAVAAIFLRIAIYLLLAVVFWKCGPWVERTLSPEIAEQDQPANGTEHVDG